MEPASRSVWAHPDMRIVLPARALSVLGDSVTYVALSVRVAQSGQPGQITALLIAFAAPVFLLSRWAGRLVDGHDSRRLLVGAGLAQVAGSAGLVWGPNLPAVLGFLVLLQVGQAITNPTWSALVPRIVTEALVGRAVAVQQSTSAAATLAGTAVGGILYDRVGYHYTVLLDTITFAVLVLAAARVRTRRGGPAKQHNTAHAAQEAGAHPGTDTGLGFVRADPLLRLLIPALWVFILTAEGTNVVEVFLVTQTLHASATVYGVVGLTFAGGTMLGPAATALLNSQRRHVTAIAAAAAAMGAALAGAGLAPTVQTLLSLYLLAGISNGVLNASISTLVTVRTPDQLRGRVSASLNGTARGFSVLALLVGGLSGQYFGPRTTLVLGGCTAILTAVPVLLSRRALTTLKTDNF